MAGDWIKVEKDLLDRPEFDEIMRLCGCTRAEAFFAWFEIWSWLDDITEDGSTPVVDRHAVDTRAGIRGFAEALNRVGWLNVR
jgi:hypothetical protein